jgi:hypothetical protein
MTPSDPSPLRYELKSQLLEYTANPLTALQFAFWQSMFNRKTSATASLINEARSSAANSGSEP